MTTEQGRHGMVRVDPDEGEVRVVTKGPAIIEIVVTTPPGEGFLSAEKGSEISRKDLGNAMYAVPLTYRGRDDMVPGRIVDMYTEHLEDFNPGDMEEWVRSARKAFEGKDVNKVAITLLKVNPIIWKEYCHGNIDNDHLRMLAGPLTAKLEEIWSS